MIDSWFEPLLIKLEPLQFFVSIEGFEGGNMVRLDNVFASSTKSLWQLNARDLCLFGVVRSGACGLVKK